MQALLAFRKKYNASNEETLLGGNQMTKIKPKIKSKKNIVKICRMYDAGFEVYEIASMLHIRTDSVQECIDLYYIKVCDSYLKK